MRGSRWAEAGDEEYKRILRGTRYTEGLCVEGQCPEKLSMDSHCRTHSHLHIWLGALWSSFSLLFGVYEYQMGIILLLGIHRQSSPSSSTSHIPCPTPECAGDCPLAQATFPACSQSSCP